MRDKLELLPGHGTKLGEIWKTVNVSDQLVQHGSWNTSKKRQNRGE